MYQFRSISPGNEGYLKKQTLANIFNSSINTDSIQIPKYQEVEDYEANEDLDPECPWYNEDIAFDNFDKSDTQVWFF